MNSIYQLIVDPPTALIAGLVILSLPLVYLTWSRRGWRRWLFLLPLATAGVLLLADALVPSDRELIDRLLHDAAKLCQAGQPEEVGKLLSERFEVQSAGRTQITGRNEAVDALRGALQAYAPETVKIDSLKVDVESADLAVARMTVKTESSTGMMAGKPIVTQWRLRLVKTGQAGWRIDQANLEQLQGKPVNDLQGMTGP